ncbi:papilin-like [Dendronephthya gigantea]|uniref:papilin-like n=1 Tax=Dendronephthya gigantea TaxID=151771 RepID=UPI00106BCC8B|nr:papilin-like [Dendronephthya gigantea]
MKSLFHITVVLIVFTFTQCYGFRKGGLGFGLRRRYRPCRIKFPIICGSDGKTYRGVCELNRARLRSRKSIKIVKLGKCPTCQIKEPVNCLVPGCFRPSCKAYPKAICVSFCGCDSQYFYRGRKVDCNQARKVNPCKFKSCGSGGICKVVKQKAVCVLRGVACSLPKIVGPCRARILRFYYNSQTRQCERFYYGGCRGNRNNFKTKEFCEETCKTDRDLCTLPAVPGPCEAHIERYFYNSSTSKCEKFYYGGCEGNENNFETIMQCKKSCKHTATGNLCALVLCGGNGRCKVENGKPVCVSPENPCLAVKCSPRTTCGTENNKPFCRPDFCLLPSKTGPCRARKPRYFYNRKTGRCEGFIYGGCRGNKNNFLTREECNNQCRRQGACPPGQQFVNCLVPPCQNAKCQAYPGARCKNNYCGGCNADFYVNDKKVECNDLCANVSCNASMECKVILGEAICRPVLANPCIATLCLVGTRCIVENGEGKCVPITPLPTVHPLCAAVTCLRGTKCIVRNNRLMCVPTCSSSRRCKQQGSFCNQKTGVCECQRFCLAIHDPRCGSDGRRYGNQCNLDAAACRKKTTIINVPCRG